MSSNENISVTKGHVYLFALLCDRRRPSLYEQQRDTFIGQAMTEIWAFQQIVFGLGDSSDSSTIVRMNQYGYEGVLLVISDVIMFNLSQSATLENNHKAAAPF